MKLRNSISAAVCSAMIITSTQAVAGDTGKVVAGAAGAAALLLLLQQNNKNKNKSRNNGSGQRVQQQQQRRVNPQRQQNIETQNALNTFGFNVGRADGDLGPKSRAAIGNYQDYMGYPRSGYLDNQQRAELVDGMNRYNAGGGGAFPEVTNNEGTKGLLRAFRDPNYADRYRNGNNNNDYANNGGYDNNNNGYGDNNGYGENYGTDNNDYASRNDDDLSLPDLDLDRGITPTSMATHCELVAGLTQANQGRILAVNISDPEQALGEQFCDARTFAMTETTGAMTNARFTEDQLTSYCDKVGQNMQPAITAMSAQNLKFVATKSQDIANDIYKGDMKKAGDFGKLCLGNGYRRDDAQMALGGALSMVAAGQMPYSEVMGHHLRWGFGTDKSGTYSEDWYTTALSAMDQGAEPAFLPSKTVERNTIIRGALAAPFGKVAPIEAYADGDDGLALPDLSLD